MTSTTASLELTLPGGEVIDVEVTLEGTCSPPDPSVGWGGSVDDGGITGVVGSSDYDQKKLQAYIDGEIWETATSEADAAYDEAMEAKGDAMRERNRGL